MTSMDFKDDTLSPVEILWSEKYACPVYKVGGKTYVEDTGEYAGYFDEVTDQMTTKPLIDTKGVNGDET